MPTEQPGHGGDQHPHKPTPNIEATGNGLRVEESGLGSRVAGVDPNDGPLFSLLMDVIHEADAHCPDLMPAALADHCRNLIDVRRTVTDIEKGRVTLDGYAQYGMSYCHNVRDAIDEWRDRPPIRLVIVGCSASKHEDDGEIPARERYRGSYWSCKREYGSTVGDEWRILSAKYGLITPDQEIPHYDRTVDDLDGVPVHADRLHRLPNGKHVRTKLDQWAADVYDALAQWLVYAGSHGSIDPRDVELEVLLGKRYREPLEARGVFDRMRARGALSISFPFQEEEQAAGGNGNQMAWMTDEVEAATAAATDGGVDVAQ